MFSFADLETSLCYKYFRAKSGQNQNYYRKGGLKSTRIWSIPAEAVICPLKSGGFTNDQSRKAREVRGITHPTTRWEVDTFRSLGTPVASNTAMPTSNQLHSGRSTSPISARFFEAGPREKFVRSSSIYTWKGRPYFILERCLLLIHKRSTIQTTNAIKDVANEGHISPRVIGDPCTKTEKFDPSVDNLYNSKGL